jgi:murein tripeptide amidase MpaA
MINVDGVAQGNYRFSASGADLNRKWKHPSEIYHP